MNDMTRFWRIPTPRPERPLRTAITRGFLGRCPACGRGRLFRSYLKVVNTCKICGEDLSHQRADDAPAYLTLLIVAHGVGAGILLVRRALAAFIASLGGRLLAHGDRGREPHHLASRQGRRRRPAMGLGDARVRGRRRPDVTEAARPDRAKSARALRPRDAATLILVERPERGGARVLMGKRHAGHRFMPGKFVFPGGRVEPEDRRMAAAGALDPDVEAKLNVRVRRPSPHFARALALAAIRETFEETGLAIGVPDYGAPENPPPGAWTRFAATGVTPALDVIDFLARAITPPGRPRRFDARFLIADATCVARRVEGAVHPEAELVELVWTPLNEALNLDLPEITRAALADLTQALDGGLDKRRPRPFYRQLRGKRLREQL